MNSNSEKSEGILYNNTINENIIIVDDDDNVLYESTRKEMRLKNLGHRACQIIIFNPETKLYTIQKRSMKKEYFPGYFEIGAGGVVGVKDTEISLCAQRELKEELGIDITLDKLSYIGKNFHKDQFSKGWSYIFYTEYSGKYEFLDGEVEEVQFWTKEKIFENEKNITPDCFKCFEVYLKSIGDI